MEAMPAMRGVGVDTSTPSFMLDPDMSGPSYDEPDLEFFDASAFHTDTAGSPELILSDGPGARTHYLNTYGSLSSKAQAEHLGQATFLNAGSQTTYAAPLASSPSGSYQDSVSDSSNSKHKFSSESSPSSPADYPSNQDEPVSARWKDNGDNELPSPHARHPYTTSPAEAMDRAEDDPMGSDPTDSMFEDIFDFNGLAGGNAPGSGDTQSSASPEISARTNHAKPTVTATMENAKSTEHIIPPNLKAHPTSSSRETSPLSTAVFSQGTSPGNALATSPASESMDISPQFTMRTPLWPMTAMQGTNANIPMHQAMYARSAYLPMPPLFPTATPIVSALVLHPTPFKSRVETQINIKMTLFPIPVGVSRIHLPTLSIAKPKLMAKPTPKPSPDMLELTTMLVCTSAMANPENKHRALLRAAAIQPGYRVFSEAELAESPLDGGEVRICPGCIQREKKRAARKKTKKPEEELEWQKYEAQRIVVFNTNEIKELSPPTSQPPTKETGFLPEPVIPDGALQVDAAMRIACYCRHHHEKVGFQVIFTLKDWQGHLVAQVMSQSIMITDDHKTPAIPPMPSEQSLDGLAFSPGFAGLNPYLLSSSNLAQNPFHLSQSVPNLATMRQPASAREMASLPPRNPAQSLPIQASQQTTTSTTPRNLSRQGSPSLAGPATKKRRASGGPKVSTDLMMTRFEMDQTCIPASAPASADSQSPFVPNFMTRSVHADANHPRSSRSFRASVSGPSHEASYFGHHPRPQSMDHVSMQHMYSAPVSARQSRAPSPSSQRMGVPMSHHRQHQSRPSHLPHINTNNINLAMPASRPSAVMNKLIPHEGPMLGGNEVTVLGNGFTPRVEVMFGEVKATCTTFWGEHTLVCIVPPSQFAGVVPITFVHEKHSATPSPTTPSQTSIFYKYSDDNEIELLKNALVVVGRKMTGQIQDVRDIARSITQGINNFDFNYQNDGNMGSDRQRAANLRSAALGLDVEDTVLRFLEMIDLDDSPHIPKLNRKREATGQTMLHMASSLGLHRVVAGLLARGAHPDPRDNGGFTPMHFAALHNHAAIVKRLMLHGADQQMRSLDGFLPGDMASSHEVLAALTKVYGHVRESSRGSFHSRFSSGTSLKSLWEPEIIGRRASMLDSEDDEDDIEPIAGGFYLRSRRPSVQHVLPEIPQAQNSSLLEVPTPANAANLSPTAAVLALRDQISAQIQHLQQVMHHTLPNLPQIPQMPALPDYQAYLPAAPMVRRISNLVGHRPSSPPSTKQGDSKWWDLFSTAQAPTTTAPPPAYDELYPDEAPREDKKTDVKQRSAVLAAAEAVADQTCMELFDNLHLGEPSQQRSMAKGKEVAGDLGKVIIGRRRDGYTREQQDRLRRAHAERLQRGGDRKLFLVWIPLLITIVLAMLYHGVPQVWAGGVAVVDWFRADVDSKTPVVAPVV